MGSPTLIAAVQHAGIIDGEPKANVEFAPLFGVRNARDGVQGIVKACQSLWYSSPIARSEAGVGVIPTRPSPVASLAVVRGEDRVVLSEIGGVHGFNGFPDLPMQQYTSWLDEPTVCYLAYAVVTEVESAVQYA